MAQRKEVWQEATAVRGQAAKLMQEGKFTEASAKYTEAEEAYTRCENTAGALMRPPHALPLPGARGTHAPPNTLPLSGVRIQ